MKLFQKFQRLKLKTSQLDIFKIFFRYLIIFVSGLSELYIYYLIFTPLTVYLVYFFLKIFAGIFNFNVLLVNNVFFLKNYSIEIIKACVGGSAYFLLFALNLSIPFEFKKRLKALGFSFSVLLLFNVFRILILITVLFLGISLFNEIHKIFWYFLNILAVALIWLAEIKIFKIKEIPVYSDLKLLYKKL